MKFGAFTPKGGVTPLPLINHQEGFIRSWSTGQNLWTKMGEIEGSRKKGKGCGVLAKEEGRTAGEGRSTGSTLWSTALASANSQH